jgi:hypothetical protein
MCLGSSPTGTMSGASCSLIDWASTNRHLSCTTTYGSSGHEFFPSWSRLSNPLPNGHKYQDSQMTGTMSARTTYASHRRGKLRSVPTPPPGWLSILVLRHPLHCRNKVVAREESCEALMTIPGSRTSFVRVLACDVARQKPWPSPAGCVAEKPSLTVNSRNCNMFCPLLIVTCTSGISISPRSPATPFAPRLPFEAPP